VRSLTTGLPGWVRHSLFPAALVRLGNHGVDSDNLPDNQPLHARCQDRFPGHPGALGDVLL
jgi:hypothetical protein